VGGSSVDACQRIRALPPIITENLSDFPQYLYHHRHLVCPSGCRSANFFLAVFGSVVVSIVSVLRGRSAEVTSVFLGINEVLLPFFFLLSCIAYGFPHLLKYNSFWIRGMYSFPVTVCVTYAGVSVENVLGISHSK